MADGLDGARDAKPRAGSTLDGTAYRWLAPSSPGCGNHANQRTHPLTGYTLEGIRWNLGHPAREQRTSKAAVPLYSPPGQSSSPPFRDTISFARPSAATTFCVSKGVTWGQPFCSHQTRVSRPAPGERVDNRI